MTKAWPLLPVILIMISIAIVIGGVLFAIMPRPPVQDAFPRLVETSDVIVPSSDASIAIVHPPNQNGASDRQLILNTSPFHPERQAFSRQAIAKPKAPPKKVYNPVIVGFLGRGDSRRVMITWEPGRDPLTHAIGDQTPWGILSEIGSSSLNFIEGEQQRQLSLFD
ncbi:MAG: hypothetical protein AAFX02_10595 [Pseudomonadota bacterium]